MLVYRILHSQTPSFFDAHFPLNFATFASPWLGMPRYSTYLSSFAAGVGSRMLGRTGEQLYISDKGCLLARMARKGDRLLPLSIFSLRTYSPAFPLRSGDVFYEALELFEKVDVCELLTSTLREETRTHFLFFLRLDRRQHDSRPNRTLRDWSFCRARSVRRFRDERT